MKTILLRLNENTQSVETITFFHHKERAKPTIFWTSGLYTNQPHIFKQSPPVFPVVQGCCKPNLLHVVRNLCLRRVFPRGWPMIGGCTSNPSHFPDLQGKIIFEIP